MSCFKIVEPFTVAGSKNAGSEVKAFLNFLLISDLDGHDRKKSMAVLGISGNGHLPTLVAVSNISSAVFFIFIIIIFFSGGNLAIKR